jgi:hypothetical protein
MEGNVLLNKKLNRLLDKMAQPYLPILRCNCSSYKVCGYTGLTLAVFLTMTLVTLGGLSHWVIVGIALTGVFTFLALAMATKIITGEEQLIYYHHEIAIMMMTAIFLKIINQTL